MVKAGRDTNNICGQTTTRQDNEQASRFGRPCVLFYSRMTRVRNYIILGFLRVIKRIS